MVAPAASDVDGVVQWLAARGYSTVQRHGDALTVSKKKEGAKDKGILCRPGNSDEKFSEIKVKDPKRR